MPTGYIDPETGVYIFGDADPAGPMHNVLNLAQWATRDVQLGNESRLAQLEMWVGAFNATVPWANVPSPHTGNLDAGTRLRYRRQNETVYVEGGLRTQQAVALYAIIATLPDGFRPLEPVFTLGYNSNGGGTVRLLFRPDGGIQTYSALPGTNDLTVTPLTFWTAS